MTEFKCQCEGCTGTLHPSPEAKEKGRKNIFTCEQCGCFYGFIVTVRTPKCCGKESKTKVLLTIPFNTETPKRKRGRPRKEEKKEEVSEIE